MPRKRAESAETISYTITIPGRTVSMIDALISTGLFGATRAEVTKNLVLDKLKQLVADDFAGLKQKVTDFHSIADANEVTAPR